MIRSNDIFSPKILKASGWVPLIKDGLSSITGSFRVDVSEGDKQVDSACAGRGPARLEAAVGGGLAQLLTLPWPTKYDHKCFGPLPIKNWGLATLPLNMGWPPTTDQ